MHYVATGFAGLALASGVWEIARGFYYGWAEPDEDDDGSHQSDYCETNAQQWLLVAGVMLIAAKLLA